MDSYKNFIFIDNGYDSIKCAQYSTNIYHDFDYFTIPSILVADMTEKKAYNFKKEIID